MIQFIPIIGSIVSGLFKSKEARTAIKAIKAEGAIKLAQTQVDAAIVRAQSDSESAGTQDEIALRQVGWKDDLLVVILCIPLVLAFIPSMVQYVEAGFTALESMPEYYQWLVGGMFVYVFGFKRILAKAINKLIETKFK